MTNYEVDKTVRVTRNATGSVKRLNAAVVVNNRSVTDAKGKTTTQPLAPDELEKLTALVKESVGFNAERGDSVKVINAPFRVEPQSTVEMPIWKQPETIDLLRTLAAPAALAAVALLVFFGLVRPALRAMPAAAPPGQRLLAVAHDAEAAADRRTPAPCRCSRHRARTHTSSRPGQLAKQNPAAVAGIVRDWVASGQAA